MRIAYCNDWSTKNKDALNIIQSDEEISQLPYVINKIISRGIYYIEKDGNQIKVKIAKFTRHGYEEIMTIEEVEDLAEAQAKAKKPWYSHIPAHLRAFPDRKAIARHPHI